MFYPHILLLSRCGLVVSSLTSGRRYAMSAAAAAASAARIPGASLKAKVTCFEYDSITSLFFPPTGHHPFASTESLLRAPNLRAGPKTDCGCAFSSVAFRRFPPRPDAECGGLGRARRVNNMRSFPDVTRGRTVGGDVRDSTPLRRLVEAII